MKSEFVILNDQNQVWSNDNNWHTDCYNQKLFDDIDNVIYELNSNQLQFGHIFQIVPRFKIKYENENILVCKKINLEN